MVGQLKDNDNDDCQATDKCPNCDNRKPEFAEYCSEECKYNSETGFPGEEY